MCHYMICWLLWKRQIRILAAGSLFATVSLVPTKLIWGHHTIMCLTGIMLKKYIKLSMSNVSGNHTLRILSH